jgi:hypothetical protein
MKARLYCRSRSLLFLVSSASDMSFEGCSSVSVTPLASDLACLCHERGLYQTIVVDFSSQGASLVMMGQIDSPIVVFFSLDIWMCFSFSDLKADEIML